MATFLKRTLCLVCLLLVVACTNSGARQPTEMPRFPQPQAHTIKAPSTTTPVPSLTQEAASSEEKVLTILYWQAPTVPGPYLSGGTKDRDAGAVTLEPLAKYDPDGNPLPALAAAIPTLENGGFRRTSCRSLGN